MSSLISLVPTRPRARDAVLALGSAALLAALMAYRGDVTQPRGPDPRHPLGHAAALLHSGHIPGAVFFGLVLAVLAAVGILGLLGDSPLDLRGDEVVPAHAGRARRPWWAREGAWLAGFCVLLYVPAAGAYGLWDPWETHYAEVAREVLARDDWITLWWGQEGWFMSKPVLIFWMSALGMGAGSTFGLEFWSGAGPGLHEWWIRLPVVAFAIGAVYAVYRAVALPWGRRAGLLCGLVLATTPHWFFLAHQAMTDMPFVAPLTIAMALLMVAVTRDPASVVRARRVVVLRRALRVSPWHLAVGAIVLLALPQVLYLLTRAVVLACPAELHDHGCRAALSASRVGPVQVPVEVFWSGSAVNSVYHDAAASMPGSPPWEERYGRVPFAPSFVQGLVWLALGAAVLWSLRRERRAQALAFTMVYLFGAVSFLGKGPAGLGVPEATLLAFLLVTGRWSLLARLRLAQGAAIFALCGLPWYVAIYCRLGAEYVDRFVVHDLFARALAGVHGDTGTFRYYVGQLGYALFPWSGLAVPALLGWRLYVPRTATTAQRDVARLAVLWAAVTFTLFSLMATKFHHYIFPMVPGAAIAVGLLLHRMMGDPAPLGARRGVASAALTLLGTALLVLGVAHGTGVWHGHVPPDTATQPARGHAPLGVALGIAGALALAGAHRLARRADATAAANDDADDASRAALGAVGLGAAVVLALVARDLGDAAHGASRLVRLFTYNYQRPFPTRWFDYHAVLVGFGAVAVVAAVMLAASATRRLGARTLVALAACLAFFCLDRYMLDLSVHWSQRGLLARYHEARAASPDAPPALAAFQMNWKGENFYTGNSAAMIDCGLPACTTRLATWLSAHQGERVFVVTEHDRAGAVSAAVARARGRTRAVTDARDNLTFVLLEVQL